MVDYLPFIIFLMILAVFLRAESALTIFYMVLGTFILGYWWNKRGLRHVEFNREYLSHAFLGDVISVELTIKNTSILPILWLEIHEGLPANFSTGKSVKQVVSLSTREEKKIHYYLNARQRGFYTLGPMLISSGDPLGLMKPTQREYPGSPLTVYPQIIDMSNFGLPSQSPFGTIKHHNPVYEDPSRIFGKRNYQNGDSLRRIDWKSTAATGQLQVKLYEASISLEVAILLDLHHMSYDIKNFFTDSELAIAGAASVAAWGKTHQQTMGLVTNGIDPYNDQMVPKPLKPKKGTEHFINILEILARIQPSETLPIDSLIQDALTDLSWGATLVVISGGLQESTLNLLFQAKKRGINPAIIFTGHSPNYRSLEKLAKFYKINLFKANYPLDLKLIGMTTP